MPKSRRPPPPPIESRNESVGGGRSCTGVVTGDAPARICASEPARLGRERDRRSPGPRAALSAEALSSVFWMPRSWRPPGRMRSVPAAGPVGVDEKSALGPDGVGREPVLGADMDGRSGVCIGGRGCWPGPDGLAAIWLRRSG